MISPDTDSKPERNSKYEWTMRVHYYSSLSVLLFLYTKLFTTLPFGDELNVGVEQFRTTSTKSQ